MTKVFIDGSAGTTGLRIYERLSERKDLELLILTGEMRKNNDARRQMLDLADIAFLCLPDKAAVEAVSLIENDRVAVIDTSTAHRTHDDWAYGFAELSDAHRQAIRDSKRIANPGCHASGFISTVYPLVSHGVVPADFPLTAYSLTGYSGGGKALIAEYEDENRDPRHDSHRIYGTGLTHKHLPEMQKICGLEKVPVFSPILGDFYAGMATSVLLPGFDARKVWQCLADHYAGEKIVTVAPFGGDEALVYANTYAGKDTMRIQVSGHGEQAMVTAIFDNLGKGASGAAIQNMNILLGVEETTGLNV
ncbi:MAG: N-acetyl-gamma-glutamyl-phosphate reductase [Oscillospiraceae bacterium]|nr:N-acetyl-gamma-glutamyl-phosphate reductase [Oscillospiraceae bacterium]